MDMTQGCHACGVGSCEFCPSCESRGYGMTHPEYELGKNLEKTSSESSAQIAQLKAELELTKKERDQAIYVAVIHSDRIGIFSMARVRDVSNFPELYAHLAGRGK